MAHNKRPSKKHLAAIAELRSEYRRKRNLFIVALIAAIAIWLLYTSVGGMFNSQAASLVIFAIFAILACVVGTLGYKMSKVRTEYTRRLNERGLTEADLDLYEEEHK